jgi:hypothetical protein
LTRSHFVLLTLALSALQLQPQTPKPLWEADLSHFGYQGRPPAAVRDISPDYEYNFDWALQQGVAFIDANVAVAYFVSATLPPAFLSLANPQLPIHFVSSRYF